MAYVGIASSRGYHLAVAYRSRAPGFLSASPRSQISNYVNLQGGCFSPHMPHVEKYNFVHGQRRDYASVGGSVRKAGAGWLRRKLYTLVAVAGLSGGALIFVSCFLNCTCCVY